MELDKEAEEIVKDTENMKNENARMAMCLRELEDRVSSLERCNQGMVGYSVNILDKVIKIK